MAALRFLSTSVTQGSADAFAIASMVTALSGAAGIAYRMRELVFELSRAGITTGAFSAVELALSRRVKTAMPLITDVDVIERINKQVQYVTSGSGPTELVYRFHWDADDAPLIVEDPLYLCIDSTATAVAVTGYCRFGYEQVKISEVDRLTLLTQSLTS